MNIEFLLSADIQKFIKKNLDTDLTQLLLKKSPDSRVEISEIVSQIKGRKVAQQKFPFLLKEEILFPKSLSLEQSSSSITAEYKKNIVKKGQRFLDLTLGFGIDAFFLSDLFSEIFLVERQKELIEIVEHNWKNLGKKAFFICSELLNFLQNDNQKYDLIYLDPARRDFQKNKVFLLEDLSPNILEILPILMEKSQQILVKLSPMIDISYLISSLDGVQEIHIVGVKNEVKEVLVLIENKPLSKEKIKIKAVNLQTNQSDFFFKNEDRGKIKSSVHFSSPQSYIYLPNSSILKSMGADLLCSHFGLKKLEASTWIYTSDEKKENFPGRILKMKEISSKEIKKGSQYNIISKNYPLKPEEIKKKYKLKDGGEHYIIFTKSIKGKVILTSE